MAETENTHEVKTVFTLAADAYDARMAKSVEQAEKFEKATTRAQKANERFSGAKAASTKLSEHEKEEFGEAREERKARRQRMLVQKVEMQKEQTLHRLADMALLSVVGEENKLAAQLAKSGAMAQGMGATMSGFGGTIGKVGSTLASLGGYAALAGLAVEGTSVVLEAFGVDVEEMGEHLKQWGKGVLGMASRERATLESLGFKSEADRKAAEEIERRQAAESAMRGFLEENADNLKKLAASKLSGAQERYEEQLMDLTKEARKTHGSLAAISLPDAMAKVEEQMKATSEYFRGTAAREAQLEHMEKDLVESGKLTAIGYKATAAQMAEHYENAQRLADAERERGHIATAETAAFAAALVAQAEHYGAMQNEIAAMKETEERQVKMADAVKQYTKMLHVVPLSATVDATNKMNNAMLALAAQAAEAIGIRKGAEMEELLSRFKTAATEKQHRVFDFRGSHFDIKQAFEGMDPGKVSVGFVNDLAAMGERRVQSAFAPLFGVR